MVAIVFKLLVAMASGVLGAAVLRHRSLGSWSEQRFVSVALAVQLIPGIALFVALYGVGHQQLTSDVPAYYMPAARAALAGQIPYRDFPLSYAPLFPYVGAVLLSVWNSGKVFALFGILMNAVTLLAWHACTRLQLGRQTAREATVLFAASGHVLVQALLGTNQTWIAAALGCSALLLARGKSLSCGLVQGLTVCAVKILVVLFWPVLWIFAPRKLHWLCGAVLLSIGIYGAFAASGADLLYPIQHEGQLISSANLPYLLEPLLGQDSHSAHRLFDGLAVLVLGATVVWIYLGARATHTSPKLNFLVPALALTQLVFMLISKKSFTGYALFCLYPVMVLLLRGSAGYWQRVTFFIAFNALLATEPSLWFLLDGDNKPLSVWWHERHDVAVQLFIAADLAIVLAYGYLAWVATRWLRAGDLLPSGERARNPEEVPGTLA